MSDISDKITRVINKLKLYNPPKAMIVVFDRAGAAILKKTVLQDSHYEILDTRKETYYVSPRIIFGILKNIKIVFLERPPYNANLRLRTKILFLIRRWYDLYLLSCLEIMQPRVVITCVDNDKAFGWLSRKYCWATFIAVQNGNREESWVSGSLLGLTPRYRISMPHFYCFGQREVDMYKEYDCEIDNFYPLGSLNAGYYLHEIADQRQKIKYDLCIISTWRRWLHHDVPCSQALRIWYGFTRRYVRENGLRVCVAFNSRDADEAMHFKDQLGSDVDFFYNDRMEMTTFLAIDRSVVALTFGSTAGKEAFGWGKRVLFCNYSGLSDLDFEVPGPWFVSTPSYSEFKKKLDCLRSCSDDEYRELAQHTARYLMRFDRSMPAHVALRQQIHNCLKEIKG